MWDCCVLWYIFLMTYHDPQLDWATSNIRLAWCGSSTTTDGEGHKRCCWPCHCATAATSVPGAPSGICQLCHGFSTGKFLFQIWASHWFGYMNWCLFCCMFSAFRYHAGCHIHQCGLNFGVCTIAAFCSIPMAGICAAWWWSSAHARNALHGCSLHCFK